MSAIRAIRQRLRPIRRLAEAAHTRMIELPYLLRRPAFGSAEWLDPERGQVRRLRD